MRKIERKNEGGAPQELNYADVQKAVGEVASMVVELRKNVEEREQKADALIDEKIEKLQKAIDEQQQKIDQYAIRMRRKAVYFNGEQVDVEELDQKAADWANMIARRRGQRIEEYTHEQLNEYKRAFDKYLRKDDAMLEPEEKKALSVGSDPDGGYTVAPDTSGRIIQNIFETSPLRAYATTQMISTDVLEGLYDLDETGAVWVSETTTSGETTTPKFGVWRIPVHELAAEPRATQKLLDDSMVNVEGWLVNKISQKMARTENTAFVLGDGVGKPRGLLSYPAGTTNPGEIEVINSGVNGSFTADNIIDLVYSLKSEYRANGVFFMNRLTVAAVRKLKDTNGRYYWQESMQAGEPSRLLGYPVIEFADMPDYTTTGALAIGFGDLREAYTIAERHGIRIIRDIYTSKPFVKFFAYRRVGGDVVNFDAVKLLAMTA